MAEITDFDHELMREEWEKAKPKPGICIPWEEKKKNISEINGDEELFKKVWEDVESLAYNYIWQVLLSF